MINNSSLSIRYRLPRLQLPKLIYESFENKKYRYRKRAIYKLASVVGAVFCTFFLFALVFMEQSLDEEPVLITKSQGVPLSEMQEEIQEETLPQQVVEKVNPDVPEMKAMPEIVQVDIPLLKLDYAINTNSSVAVHVPTPPSIEQIAPASTPTLQAYSLDQVDEKPSVLYNPRPAYPKGALRSKIQGQVIARVLVNSEGRVMNVQILDGPYADIFRNESITALKRWRFKPGKIQGKQVTTIIEIPLVFSLK